MSSLKVPYVGFKAQFAESKEAILNAVQGVFERGDFIHGKDVELFEQEFAKLCGVKHAVSVANGTDSLMLALKALNIGKGDEVITASNSWVSSASAIALIGATPVFADVQTDQNISPQAIDAAITLRTKAILPVHLTGRCADMKAILEIGRRHGIPVIEDAAQAVTASIDGIMAGAGGLINSFSLHPLKNLNAAGDAGILTTNNDDLAHQLKLLRNHGLKNRDEIIIWGHNSRLDTIQAAVLRTRLPLLAGYIERRRQIAKCYINGLAHVVQCPIEKDNERHTYHVFVIQCDRRDELQRYLSQREIETKIHYIVPIHLQEAARYLGYRKGSLPVTETQRERILSLPINPYLNDDQIDCVIEAIQTFYR